MYEGDRKITYIILSNKINMNELIKVNKESARKAINKIIKDKVQQKETMDEDRKKALKEILRFNDLV